MKKLIVIILILMFLPVSMNAAENQKIIFGGSYSIDNETTDADSAWLYIFNNAILVDSTTVTAEDLQWDGCYQYAHECTNDSTDGWTGWWVYFGESEAVSLSEWAIVATARDSSYALETSVTAVRDSMDEAAQIADTTDIKASLQYWLDKLTVASNLDNVRYVSGSGDNTNGLSLATAWTSLDSVANLNSPTKVLVMPGWYADVSCTVRTDGIELIGVGGAGATHLRGTSGAYHERMIVVNPRTDDSLLTGLRITGFSFGHPVPAETADPNFKCAIHIQDSSICIEIDHNIFIADSNFKTIASYDTHVRYLYIHDNLFAGNRVHAIDVAPEYSIFSNNYFLEVDSTDNDLSRVAIQLFTKARWNIIEGNYFTTQEIAVSLVGADSNLVAANFFGINDADASEMTSDINAVGNVFAANYGKPYIKLRESTSGDEIGTWEDRFYKMMKIIMMRPLSLSVIPNGDFQLISNEPDSTGVESWGTAGGTYYITGRRGFGGLPRTLYLGSASYQNTLLVYLAKGLHQVSVWAWLAQSENEVRISAYNDEAAQQTWADGSAYVSGTGYTAWRKIGGKLYLPADDYYYFSLGTPDSDSAYFSGFTVYPDVGGDSTHAAIADANKENFKADVSGLSTLTDNELRIALGDTLYNSRTDSILAVLAIVAADVLDIAYYWGACDGCYYRLYPESGTSNKDSAIVIDPSLGPDSMVAKVVYLHGTDVQVVDTVYFYRDEPW